MALGHILCRRDPPDRGVHVPVVVLLAVALLLAVATPAQADGRYIGLGDSVAAASDSYVTRFGSWLAAHEGVTDVRTLAGGETSSSILGARLTEALALIDDATDTRYVTIDIGGNDFLNGECGWNRADDPSCAFPDNLSTLLSRITGALANDPGEETVLVMGYYNPYSGGDPGREADGDRWLLGSDGTLDTTGIGAAWGTGGAWGISDVTAWVACRYGATFVDARPAFKAGGPALIFSDHVHPTSAGQAVLAGLFEDAVSGGGGTPPCPATTPFAIAAGYSGGELHGIVEPRLTTTRWWVEYGDTTAYGHSTPVQELPATAGPRAVSTPLAAGTCHARLVVENDQGRHAAQDQAIAPAPCPVPDTTAPTLRLRANATQRLGRALSVIVECPDEACTATATGRLTAGPRFRLGRAKARIARGGHATLRLSVPAVARKVATKALRKHRRATATIQVVVRDPAGNAAKQTRTLRLKI